MTLPIRPISIEHVADNLHARLLDTLDEIDNLDEISRTLSKLGTDRPVADQLARVMYLRRSAQDRLQEILRVATDRWTDLATRNCAIIRADFRRWCRLRAWRGAGVDLYTIRTPLWLGGAASWGICYFDRNPSRRVMDVACSFDLAETRTTLLHEMSHAAVFYFSGLRRRVRNELHGITWRNVYAEACAEITGCYPLAGAAAIDQDVSELMRELPTPVSFADFLVYGEARAA